MATIHEGVYKTFPLLNDTKHQKAFGPDKSDAARKFSFAVGSLHYFLVNTVVDSPHNYKQCTRCLKISSKVTTDDAFNAHLQTCNQDVDAARLTVINTTIKEACDDTLRWKDEQTSTAHDQVVLAVINSQPPPFSADPRILEWIDWMAKAAWLEAKANATAHAIEEARSVYKAQLTSSRLALNADLQAICDNHDAQLAQARKDTATKLLVLKFDLSADWRQCQADHEPDRLIGKASKHKQVCLTLLTMPTVCHS